MKRFASVAVWVLVALLSGCCSTCQNPWDYCNAVLGCGGCPYCDFGARCGSAFAPIGATPTTTERTRTEAGGTSEQQSVPDETAEPYNAPPPESGNPFDGSDDAPSL